MTGSDIGTVLGSGGSAAGAFIVIATLVDRGYLYLKREYRRESNRADRAEAKAAKYEDALLKSTAHSVKAADDFEEFADKVLELARQYEAKP